MAELPGCDANLKDGSKNAAMRHLLKPGVAMQNFVGQRRGPRRRMEFLDQVGAGGDSRALGGDVSWVHASVRRAIGIDVLARVQSDSIKPGSRGSSQPPDSPRRIRRSAGGHVEVGELLISGRIWRAPGRDAPFSIDAIFTRHSDQSSDQCHAPSAFWTYASD